MGRAQVVSIGSMLHGVTVSTHPNTFAAVFAAYPWRPITACPGRYVLEDQTVPLREIVGTEAETLMHVVAGVRDEVLVTQLADGRGLITYRRSDGSQKHTLGDADGFLRKLRQLGLR